MHDVDYLSVAEKAIRQIEEGAFLIVQAGDAVNVMTIGWASIGCIWGRPMMTVLVRHSRYTFAVIEHAADFAVCVPLVDMRQELEICGSQSGRAFDKLKKCRLELFPSEKIKTPVLNFPGIHFECRIAYTSPMVPMHLIDSYKHLYPTGDYHSIYFGEIMRCYSSENETRI